MATRRHARFYVLTDAHLLGSHVGRATGDGRRLQRSPLQLARAPEVRHLDVVTGSSRQTKGRGGRSQMHLPLHGLGRSEGCYGCSDRGG
jgi:hypothetical protein